MLAFAGEPERGVLRWCFLLLVRLTPPLLRRVSAAVAAIGVGADSGAFGVLGLFDHLFALLHLGGEGGLGGGLGVLRGFLSAVNLGRVLWGGQVGQLQIRGTNRHDR